jgi:hypothetical protein
MQTTALKLTALYKDLSLLPDNKINEVKKYIELILTHEKIIKKKIAHLKGIWAHRGFEKIYNLKKELNLIRKEITTTILNKKI